MKLTQTLVQLADGADVWVDHEVGASYMGTGLSLQNGGLQQVQIADHLILDVSEGRVIGIESLRPEITTDDLLAIIREMRL